MQPETVGLNDVQQDKFVTRFKADRDDQYCEFFGKCGNFQCEIAKVYASGP